MTSSAEAAAAGGAEEEGADAEAVAVVGARGAVPIRAQPPARAVTSASPLAVMVHRRVIAVVRNNEPPLEPPLLGAASASKSTLPSTCSARQLLRVACRSRPAMR